MTIGAAGRQARRTGSVGAAAGPGPRRRRLLGGRAALWVAATGVVVLAVVAAACGASPASSSSTGARHASPLVAGTGGSVTVGLDDVPETLNDHTVAGDTAVGRMIASAVWPQVFRIEPGLSPQLDTDVVDSAEVVDLNPQTVVYQIDPRAVWSDGVPISAADFEYAWTSQRGGALDVDGKPDSVASSLGYRDISSVTGSNGDKTVTVVFKTPFADWESLFDDLLPAHIAATVGWNSGFDHDDPLVLVSGGPWEVKSWQPGASMVLVHNPKWWAAPAELDRVAIKAVPDAAVGEALASGEVQVAYPSAFGPALMAQVSSSPGLMSETNLGSTMLQLEFNTRKPPLDSDSVRQGIAHAVDRAALVSSIGQPENHLVWEDNSHLYANLQSAYDDNDGAGYEKQDLATAARLLGQGGLVAGPLGTWTYKAAALSLSLVWADDDPWSAATGPIVAAQLEAAGIDVVEDPVSSAELFGVVLPSGGFDLAIVPVDVGAYPSAMGAVFSTSPAVAGGTPSQDWSGFDDPKIDTLFTQAVQQLGEPQAQAVYQQIDQDLWVSMPTLPLFAEPTLVVWSASVSNVSDDPGGLGPLGNMRLWALLAARNG